MTSPGHALAIEVATRRQLRVAMLFGLTSSLIVLFTTLQRPAGLSTIILAAAWSLTWAATSARPELIDPVLRHWPLTMPLIASASTATILASGGFSSLLKTDAEWLVWAAPVLLDAGASLAVAAVLSSGLLAAFLLNGMSLAAIVTSPNRYIAVTDILNPFVVVLLALVVTGVFRSVLTNAAPTLWRARRGTAASSPAMLALLASPPILALPVGQADPVERAPSPALSPAERDILQRLAAGQTPQQIALARGVRDDTVYDQIGAAKQKAGAKTIEHLIALAWHPAT
jgi:DNA-binding CsgD family transcriptional regulator